MAHQLPRPGKKLCMPFTLKVAPFIVGAVNHQHRAICELARNVPDRLLDWDGV